ncbi:MAG TPA: FAD-dependent oxidoreductase [Methylomirabilota bacterium]|nr:FAD-dependent oxidoreductase [Methylomirabilota bacterium]
MTEHARAVIVGGGVGGASVAYHLTAKGWRDIVLVERADLTSGSTFHSAGLVGQLRSSVALTRLMMWSVECYRQLALETGRDPGWKEVGSLRLACTPERVLEHRRQAGWAKTFGLPLEEIGPAEARALFPVMGLDGVLGAVYLPTDGHLDPSGLATALADGARRRGAAIRTGTRVLGITVRDGRVREVETTGGTVRTEVVVNAGGMYAPEIARMVGVTLPLIPMAHQYLVTRPIEGVHAAMPTLRDPDHLVYFREEVGGLLVGGYEREPAPWGLDGIPADFNHRLLPPDWERFAPLMEGAVHRVPAIGSAEIVRLINGPEAFTPDGEFILGEAPEVRGFFVACGFCAHGIAGSGGMGRIMADWIVEGDPGLDIWHMDLRRFGPQYRSRRLTLERTHEVYRTYYDLRYPNQEREEGRRLRLSPAYPRLRELGAVFGEKSGWERPNWFEPNAGAGGEGRRPRGFAGRIWSPAIEAEHLATRERAGLFDETSFSKLELVGSGALGLLQRLCGNDVDRPLGSVVYTSVLNERGGIECDFTVTRLGPARFRIVTGTAFGTHDRGSIQQHLPRDGSVSLLDVTGALCCIGLWGPRARDILAATTTADVSNAAFPYLTARELAVGRVPVLAARVTYVGELGWELYAPTEYGLELWDTLWEAGQPHGMVAAGYRAIDSLRLEKGYRYWSADITPDDTPYEAGLGFAVRLGKGDFLGREALTRQQAEGVRRKLACLTLSDPTRVALGGEPVRVADRVVGRVTSGGFGYTVGFSIAYAYLPADLAIPGTPVEVEFFGEWVGGVVAAEPLWDPRGDRIRT